MAQLPGRHTVEGGGSEIVIAVSLLHLGLNFRFRVTFRTERHARMAGRHFPSRSGPSPPHRTGTVSPRVTVLALPPWRGTTFLDRFVRFSSLLCNRTMLRRPSFCPRTHREDGCSSTAFGYQLNSVPAVWINPATRGSAGTEFNW